MKEKEWLMAQVGHLYYVEGCTQEAIAQQYHFSRSTVSRLLKEAQEAGIVRIEINFPWRQASGLERALVKKFGLSGANVLVSHGRSDAEMLEGLGLLGARYLLRLFRPGITLAIATGTTIYHTVQALEPNRDLGINVVQMMGVIGTLNPQIDGSDLARSLADRLGGKYLALHSPLLVQDRATAQSLLSSPSIQQTLDQARRADISLVGVGSLDLKTASLLRAGFLSSAEVDELTAAGAVGESCGRPFDEQGRTIRSELADRIMAIDLPSLRKMSQVVAVAGGLAKSAAIRAAMKGKFIDVLITDDLVAQELLNEKTIPVAE